MTLNYPVLIRTVQLFSLLVITGFLIPFSGEAGVVAPDQTLHPEKPGGELQPLDDRIPESERDDEQRSEFILPVIPPPSDKDSLMLQIKVFVNQIKVVGNTVLSQEQLKTLISPYEQREITTAELQALRKRLSQFYRDLGYIYTEAIIPDQDVENGEIIIAIIEAKLDEIMITNDGRLNAWYIENRLRLEHDQPLNLNLLQEKILLLHQDRRIDRISANLRPGIKMGEAILDVTVDESRPYDTGFSFNNHRNPSVGELHGELWGIHYNLNGLGDTLALQYSLTEGLDDFSINYSVPLFSQETRLGLYFQRSDAAIIEAPLDSFNISSETQRWGVSIRHPLKRTVEQELTGFASVDVSRNKSFLSGTPFSFSSGSINGVSKSSVLRLGLEWLERKPDRVLFASGQVNLGLKEHQQGVRSDLPDGHFISWFSRFQWVQRLPVLDARLIVKQDMQFSNRALLTLDKIGIGGASTVRGYRENFLVKDNGIVNSIELLFPLPEFTYALTNDYVIENTIQLALFTDLGWGHDLNTDKNIDEKNFIHSAGLGLRWQANDRLQSRLYWSKAFNRPDQDNNDSLQDEGIHFSLDLTF